MSLKFGTSGLRGLVTDLTPEAVAAYVTAFTAVCPTGGALYVGRDLRASSARIAGDVARAGQAAGLRVVDCGAVPTPALALASIGAGAAAVMVTGSHIPADRNGLKFYVPSGEISKADEISILKMHRMPEGMRPGPEPVTDTTVGAAYVARYVTAYGAALQGMRIGVYSHSAVGRDLLIETLRALGAQVTELGRSDIFIPVDTEAVDPSVREQLRGWADGLDAIVSTDADGDRPLLADAAGQVIGGDILGQIAAKALGARVVVTPVSSNGGVEEKGFDRVIRTRIGSPHVIAAMEGQDDVVGYEANGGFLLGFTAQGPNGPLPPLMTRDSTLPLLAALVACRGRGLAELVAAEPPRFTAADRLTEIPSEHGQALVERLTNDAAARARFLDRLGPEAGQDLTDGLRITLTDGRVVHIRPSGNAPELRIYVEAEAPQAAADLLAAARRAVAENLPYEPT